MDREWRATVVVADVPRLRLEGFEELHRRFAGVVRHEADNQRLYLVWRLDAPNLAQATWKAVQAALETLEAVLGYEPELVDLHVVTGEQANAEDG